MGIKLREKENNDGTISLYLDIYHNSKRKYEFLQQLKLIKKPNTVQREQNKKNKELAKKNTC